MLATYVDDIERLTGIGLGPFIALLVVFIVALVAALSGVCIFFWKQLGKVWALRDKERAEWHAKVEERLKLSEGKHEDCEKDRGVLRTEIDSVKTDLDRMRRCPRKDCPMRLPQ